MKPLFQNNISKEDIMNLPVGRYQGEIVCIDNRQALFAMLPGLFREKALGFDTETRPSFKKGTRHSPALLQLATQDRVWLVRLNRLGYVPELWHLFTDPRIIKTGIGIRDDLRELQQLHPFEPEGFIELQTYVKDFGIEDASLVKITAQVLGFRVSKAQRLSNWEADTLTAKQQTYAATDAWVCYMIYQTLNHHRL